MAIEVFRGLGIALGIGLSFLVIFFCAPLAMKILAWYSAMVLIKVPLLRRRFFRISEDAFHVFNELSDQEKTEVYNSHPSQTLKRLKRDGINSLFRNNFSSASPVYKNDSFSAECQPEPFFDGTYPKPLKDKSSSRTNHPFQVFHLASIIRRLSTKCKQNR